MKKKHSDPTLFPEEFNDILINEPCSGFEKLKLYNSLTRRTKLNLNGSKSDFEVFLDMLIRAKIFIKDDGKTPSKVELREFLSFILNFETAKNPYATLNEAKERAEKSEHLFTRILAAYEEFKQDVKKK
ncbi:MAG: hypothetical protein AUJ98_06140 [Bacteroidetes bacterium CG2_30_33_31]|nr:MAG: hypothetical protein AUJ98_06140 [Bacteroidetes bacterium CG2_30_33_31]